jgi:hypothetical protein
MGVLLLVKKEAIRSVHNLNAEEVVQGSQVLERELGMKTVGGLLQEHWCASREDDVFDVEQQVSHCVSHMVDKQRCIGACGAEAKLMKKRCDALVPRMWRLLEPI